MVGDPRGDHKWIATGTTRNMRNLGKFDLNGFDGGREFVVDPDRPVLRIGLPPRDWKRAPCRGLTSSNAVTVPVCLLVEPAAIGASETASWQLATGRRGRDKAILPPPTPQRTVLLLLPSLQIEPPPGRCRC